MKAYKIVRVHPISGQLVDTYSGSVEYRLGEVVTDQTNHGLSVHHTEHGATVHAVPSTSVGRNWPAKLVEVEIAESDILKRGQRDAKTLVRSLRVLRVVRDIHRDIAQSGMSGYRARDAQGWIDAGFAGFRVVEAITRGSPEARSIPKSERGMYVVECRPARSGRYGKSVAYRAVRA